MRLTSSLDEPGLARGVAELVGRDPDLGAIVERYGPPPLWSREPGFATLALMILEQQVSLASGRAAFDRLTRAVGSVEPESVLAAGPERLRDAGLTRQKTRYVRELAASVTSGALDLDRLGSMPDDAARSALVAIIGIGPWTAECYLLFALRRPDAWPNGDLALAVAVVEAKGLAARPTLDELAGLAEGWRPWRAVAARLLWHAYLSKRGQGGPQP